MYVCNLNQDCLIDSSPYSQRMGLSYIPTIRSRLPLKIEWTIMWGQARTSARAVRRHHLPLLRKMPTWPDVGIMAAINFIKKKKILTTHVNTIPVSRIYASMHACMYVYIYVCIYVAIFIIWLQYILYVCMFVCIKTLSLCLYVCMYVCMYIYIYAHG